ncbi:MAG: type II toxin-antitoxin system RelE/ParE family toxin [Lachnospiraceae bacterium]|nr:type II toxin-antitoxin system RelE/ParE family toxin [Lachnospiraceae bacterium]MDE7333362.1 type II toxin-antitoxin system RelE/ParE family toxin [Lachnospiraceae bacterium]
MEYDVVLTVQAQTDFREIINYLVYELQNQQAAASVADDFDDTVARLSHAAGSLKLCDDSVLRARGYRTIHFQKHKYLMVYTIDGDRAYVEGIYHDLQDYENILR